MKPRALHERIRQDIEARIMSGAWAVGHRIPYEHELMAAYGCSRMTVNKALSTLAGRGLLDSRKRAGTFVAAPRGHRAALDIPDIAAAIAAEGRSHRIGLIARAEREAEPADRQQLAMPNGRVLALTCLHRADQRPFALEQRLINLELVPAARTVDFARESPGAWLLAHVPWSDARHRICAIAADRATADRLGLVLGAPCLAVERWTWRGEQRITYVRQLYPGERHTLEAGFLE